MNVLTMEKAPFVLVLLLGAIGWQVSQLVGYSEADEAAFSYRVKNSATGTNVEVVNRSKTKTLRASFLLTCERGQPCITSRSQFRELTPVLTEVGIEEEENKQRVAFNVVAPPYAAFMISSQRHPSFEPPRFFIRSANSGGDSGGQFYVYDSSTPTGFLRDNLPSIILTSLLLSALAAIAYVILLWRQDRRQRAKPKDRARAISAKHENDGPTA